MGELRGRAHLALEARDGARVEAIDAQDLHCHVPIQRRVVGLPHLAHSAGADTPFQLVAPKTAGFEDLPSQRPAHMPGDDHRDISGNQVHHVAAEERAQTPYREAAPPRAGVNIATPKTEAGYARTIPAAERAARFQCSPIATA